MPWSDQGGPRNLNNDPWGQKGGPWGSGPSRGAPPPDLEELLRRSQEGLRQILPSGFGGRGAAILAETVSFETSSRRLRGLTTARSCW
jgi:membrane protease subunit HflK